MLELMEKRLLEQQNLAYQKQLEIVDAFTSRNLKSFVMICVIISVF